MSENDVTGPGTTHPGTHPTTPIPRPPAGSTPPPPPAFGAPAYRPAGTAPQAAAYPGYRPTAAFGSGGPGGPGFGPDQASAAPRRERRMWPAIVGTAALTAVLASGGSVLAINAFDEEVAPQSSTSIAGGSSSISLTTVGETTWEEIASQVAPSVVAIQVVRGGGEGEGSGVIIDGDGRIVTNNHVVAGAIDDTVQVTLSDGRIYDATIIGLDPSTDLAVVQLVDPPTDLQPASFADSDDVLVGNPVMAVGNPLGLANTVTTGIVSAVSRPVSTMDESSYVVTNAIQIDAAVNPGNSGGPLFNASGEVIGITSSIATLSSGSSQAGSIGLGFAIPSNLAQSISDQLIADGEAEHAFLGVTLSDATATADGVTRRGARVEEVTEGSPAAGAGLQRGDVIVAIDGRFTTGAESLTAGVRERVSGSDATVTYVRDGQSSEVSVTFATRPVEEGTDQSTEVPDDPSGDGWEWPGSDEFDWFDGWGN